MPGPTYPLLLEPIFKSMLWGGERLPSYLGRPAPTTDPIGEAWVLSDVDGNMSTITNGRLAGRTLREVIGKYSRQLFGPNPPSDGHFPLLLKFIDARKELSVQVHPNDEQAERMVGPGKKGKTEAWVILAADAVTSRIYAGLQPEVTEASFRAAMTEKTTPDALYSFAPLAGDCIYLPAGTVHAIGADILLFEVQQTSDTTYRLYDWDRLDAKTGKPRQLHIDQGLACVDYTTGPCRPVVPVRHGSRELLVQCPYFTLSRLLVGERTRVSWRDTLRILVGVSGRGEVTTKEDAIPFGPGSVVILPADCAPAQLVPHGAVQFLEIGVG